MKRRERIERLNELLSSILTEDAVHCLLTADIDDVCAALNAQDSEYSPSRYTPLLDRCLESDASELFSCLYPRIYSCGAIKSPGAIFAFISYLSGPVMACLVANSRLRSHTYRVLTDIFDSGRLPEERLVGKSDVDEAERDALNEVGLLSQSAYGHGVLELTKTDQREFYAAAMQVLPKPAVLSSWVNSEQPANLAYSRLFYLLSTEPAIGESNDSSLVAHRLSRPLVAAYKYFTTLSSEGARDADRYLDHIVWFMLRMFGGDAETGIFRPYSRIPSGVFDVLSDYLASDPARRLPLFILRGMDTEFAELAKYGMIYKGYEHAGSFIGGVGTDLQLDDTPLVEKLLTPAFMRFYEECQISGDMSPFLELADAQILRLNQPTSATQPAGLRRSIIPIFVRALSDQSIPAAQLAEWIRRLGKINVGMPDNSLKFFYEVWKERQNTDLYRHAAALLLELLEDEMSRSLTGVPGPFAYRVLCRLARLNLRHARQMVRDLITETELLTAEPLGLHYGISILEQELGSDSEEMELAVARLQCLPSAELRESDRRTLADYQARQASSDSLDLANCLSPSAAEQGDLEIFARSMETLSKADSGKAMQAIRSRLAGRAPWDVFPSRYFIVHVLEKFYQEVVAEGLQADPENLRTAHQLVAMLTNDPDPVPDDSHHQDIVDGKKTISISTVRGHLAFTVRYLCCSREYLSLGWKITRQLLADSNAYVVYRAFYALEELLKRRHWNAAVGREAVAELWRFFDKPELPRAHASLVVRCFHAVRDLSEDDAERVLCRFSDEANIEYLYAFYAVFRGDHADDMGPFDAARFEKLLVDAIRANEGRFAVRFLHSVENTVSTAPDSLDRLYRFLREYRQEPHAVPEVITAGFRLIDGIELSTQLRFQRALTLFRQFLRLQKRLVKASPEEAVSFECPEFLVTVFERDRKSFYAIARDLAQMIRLGATPLYMGYALEDLLAEEDDPKYAAVIPGLYDTMIEGAPWYYKQRRAWVANAKARFPGNLESEWVKGRCAASSSRRLQCE